MAIAPGSYLLLTRSIVEAGLALLYSITAAEPNEPVVRDQTESLLRAFAEAASVDVSPNGRGSARVGVVDDWSGPNTPKPATFLTLSVNNVPQDAQLRTLQAGVQVRTTLTSMVDVLEDSGRVRPTQVCVVGHAHASPTLVLEAGKLLRRMMGRGAAAKENGEIASAPREPGILHSFAHLQTQSSSLDLGLVALWFVDRAQALRAAETDDEIRHVLTETFGPTDNPLVQVLLGALSGYLTVTQANHPNTPGQRARWHAEAGWTTPSTTELLVRLGLPDRWANEPTEGTWCSWRIPITISHGRALREVLTGFLSSTSVMPHQLGSLLPGPTTDVIHALATLLALDPDNGRAFGIALRKALSSINAARVPRGLGPQAGASTVVVSGADDEDGPMIDYGSLSLTVQQRQSNATVTAIKLQALFNIAQTGGTTPWDEDGVFGDIVNEIINWRTFVLDAQVPAPPS